MRKIVWSICRFGFALCNRILSSSNAIGLDLRAGAVYRFSLAPFKYNTEVCHLEKYAAWAWSRGLVGIIFYPRGLWGMRPHLSPVTIYTLLRHKVLPVTHAHLDIRTHTHPSPISCLIQTCLMSPQTDPHRAGSTHAHGHSITWKQHRPRINPSSKASSRPFPMRMRCPKVLRHYLACANTGMWSMPP